MVSCRLSQTKAFPVKVCASEVQDISEQTVANRTCRHKIFSGKIVMLYPPFSPITPEKFGAQTSVRAAFQAFCSDGFLYAPAYPLRILFFRSELLSTTRPGIFHGNFTGTFCVWQKQKFVCLILYTLSLKPMGHFHYIITNPPTAMTSTASSPIKTPYQQDKTHCTVISAFRSTASVVGAIKFVSSGFLVGKRFCCAYS